VAVFLNIGFSEKSRINTCTELPVNDKMILFMGRMNYKKTKEREEKWASYKKMKHFIKSSGA